MEMAGALRARLLAAAPITASVAQRVYWVSRPQAAALPAITLQVINEERAQHMAGYDGMTVSRVQVDVWALTYAETKTIAEAIVAAITPAETSNGVVFTRAFFDGSRDLGENASTQFIHRTSLDFIVHHSAQ